MPQVGGLAKFLEDNEQAKAWKHTPLDLERRLDTFEPGNEPWKSFLGIRAAGCHRLPHLSLQDPGDILVEVLLPENAIPLRVDFLTLQIQHVIILQEILAY